MKSKEARDGGLEGCGAPTGKMEIDVKEKRKKERKIKAGAQSGKVEPTMAAVILR